MRMEQRGQSLLFRSFHSNVAVSLLMTSAGDGIVVGVWDDEDGEEAKEAGGVAREAGDGSSDIGDWEFMRCSSCW